MGMDSYTPERAETQWDPESQTVFIIYKLTSYQWASFRTSSSVLKRQLSVLSGLAFGDRKQARARLQELNLQNKDLV